MQAAGDSPMAKKRAFISFDAEHDESLRILLAGQAKNEDSPFEFSDWSLKEPLSGDWKKKITPRIKGVDLAIVICGEHTDIATGVSAEVTIAQAEGVPYFLLAGYSDKTCKKPKSVKDTDKLYRWTWPNLKNLVAGNR
jgi:Thoeris protein ThsB, TIR-like domain